MTPVDLPGLSRPKGAEASRRVKQWVREIASLQDDATVMVSELRCGETGCPDVETVIAIMTGGETRKITLKAALDVLARRDIEAAL